jgi:hypothetical protein
MSQGTQAVSEQWIDISLGLHDGMVHWPDNPPVQIGFVKAIDKGDVSNVSKMSMGVHSGTHMDAPLHFLQDGKSIDTMPLEASIGRARVIEIQDTESIKVAELEHHRIQMGERLLFKTINSTHYWQTDAFEKNFVFIALPHKNLPLSASSIAFPPILSWSFLQDCIIAHQLWSRRGTWPSLQRKKKMFLEASRDRQPVAFTHRSFASCLQRREACESR